MTDIVLRDVSKAFGENRVLSHLSLTLPAGRLTCLQGPSGVGKTTLLRLLAGLETPDSGSVTGVPQRVAFVFQEDRLCEDFTAVQNVLLVTDAAWNQARVRDRLREIGLEEESLSRPVRDFSGGMKRRVAIVRALCHEGELVLLDEPFKGLDETLKIRVMDVVKRRTAGRTVVCVTHEAAEAAYLGGETVRLDAPEE